MSKPKANTQTIEVELTGSAIYFLVQEGFVRLPVEGDADYSDNGLTAESEIRMLEITQDMVRRAIWCTPGNDGDRVSFYASLVGVGAVEVVTSPHAYQALQSKDELDHYKERHA